MKKSYTYLLLAVFVILGLGILAQTGGKQEQVEEYVCQTYRKDVLYKISGGKYEGFLINVIAQPGSNGIASGIIYLVESPLLSDIHCRYIGEISE